MNHDAVQILFQVSNAFLSVIDLILLAVAVVVAAICTRRRQNPAAAWVLAAACTGLFAIGLTRWVVEFSATALVGRLSPTGFQWVELALASAEILLTVLFAAGLFMFRPAGPPVAPAGEVRHG